MGGGGAPRTAASFYSAKLCNNSKSGIVTFSETKSQHFISMNKRSSILGSETAEELYEYKNLGVLKKYAGSFSSNVIDNLEKTQQQKIWEFYFQPILTEGK